MSGPKVVRVITREEQEAAARLQVQRVDAALEELRRCARRHRVLDAKFAAQLDDRRERIAQIFRQEQWAVLQRQGPAEVRFLDTERERIEADAVQAVAAARARGLRTASAARTLLAAFSAAGRKPPPGLEEVAATAEGADESSHSRMEQILSEAFRLLAPVPRVTMTTAQRELAARLGAGSEAQEFSQWIVQHSQAPSRETDARLQSLLAEVHALEDATVARPFVQRAAAIFREPNESRRALLTDSLVLELGAHRRAQRTREAIAARVREIRCELSALDTPVTRALVAQMDAALAGGGLDAAERFLQSAQSTIEAESQALAATARRRAVLEGLTALGYEVRETMATAWAEQGRIVVRKPGVPDYGIELGAPGNAARLQVRMVGAARPLSPRDTRRDRDMETVWCGEFQQLRGSLAARGSDVIVEKALEVGAEPVKTVALEAFPTEGTSETVATHGRRTLP